MTDVDRLIVNLNIMARAGGKLLLQLLELVLFRGVNEAVMLVAVREKLTSERDSRQMFAPASTMEVAMASPIPMEAPVYDIRYSDAILCRGGTQLTYQENVLALQRHA